MKWAIRFYDDKVMDSIQNWPKKIKAKFTWITELIEKFGPHDVDMPHVRPLSQGLFEIRAKGNEGIGRAFFCLKNGKVVLVLSGFIKKTQKTPQKEIEVAKRRMKEVKSNE